ncbi:putative type I restriction enzyme [bacterium HR11]|nr:putative type I restriction enzyme [bacterium HR11]
MTRVRHILERLGYTEHTDFDYEVEIRLYGTQRLWADAVLWDGSIPVVLIEVEGHATDEPTGLAEARFKAVAWNLEDLIPLIWVAAGEQDRCYQAVRPDRRAGVRYVPLNDPPDRLLRPHQLATRIGDYLKRQGASLGHSGAGELRHRQTLLDALRALPPSWNDHQRCRALLNALHGSFRHRTSRVFQKAVGLLKSTISSGSANPALAHAFRWVMRRYMRPLSPGQTDPVRRYGRYFTPPEVIQFLVQAIDPKPGERILDFACGTGGFLCYAALHLMERHEADPVDIAGQLFGYDRDAICVQIAQTFIGLLLPRYQGPLNISGGDSLRIHRNDRGPQKFDVVLSNPPAGDLPENWEGLEREGYRWAGRGGGRQNLYEVAFLEQALRLTREGGRIGLVLPEGVWTNVQLRPLRNWLLSQITVRAVVGLPRGAFPFTPSKMCAVVLEKRQPARHFKTLLAEVTRPKMAEQLRVLAERVGASMG